MADELRLWRAPRRPELREDEFWALDDVSFDVGEGQAWGVVGSNGSGKSTLLRVLHGITKPDGGEVVVRGRSGALLGLGSAFDPLQTGRENARATAAVHGLARADADARMEAVIEFSGLGELVDTPVQSYSTGMSVRLAFAVATQLDLDLLLIDESLAVGDLAFRRQCIEWVQRFVRNGGTLVLVDHDLWLIQAVCSNCLVLDHGRVTFAGPTAAALNFYLSASRPRLSAAAERERQRDGAPVWLEEAALQGLDGSAPVSEEPAVVVAQVDNSGPPRPVRWAFALTSADLTVVVAAELDEEVVKLGTGRTRLRAAIDRLTTVAGSFDLRVVVLDAETDEVLTRFGGEEGPCPVVVEAGAVDRTIHQIGRVLLTVDATWTR
jgi:ABC-type polysaccharide/polyol phosphate transport system ATPase subunit